MQGDSAPLRKPSNDHPRKLLPLGALRLQDGANTIGACVEPLPYKTSNKIKRPKGSKWVQGWGRVCCLRRTRRGRVHDCRHLAHAQRTRVATAIAYIDADIMIDVKCSTFTGRSVRGRTIDKRHLFLPSVAWERQLLRLEWLTVTSSTESSASPVISVHPGIENPPFRLMGLNNSKILRETRHRHCPYVMVLRGPRSGALRRLTRAAL